MTRVNFNWENLLFGSLPFQLTSLKPKLLRKHTIENCTSITPYTVIINNIILELPCQINFPVFSQSKKLTRFKVLNLCYNKGTYMRLSNYMI